MSSIATRVQPILLLSIQNIFSRLHYSGPDISLSFIKLSLTLEYQIFLKLHCQLMNFLMFVFDFSAFSTISRMGVLRHWLFFHDEWLFFMKLLIELLQIWKKIHFYFQQIFPERTNLFIIYHHHSAISLYPASRGFSLASLLAFTKSSLVNPVVGFCRGVQNNPSILVRHRNCKNFPINSLFIMSKLTLNSAAVFKAFSASISTRIASERAFEALSRALCASRLRWPETFFASEAISIACVKFMFAFSPKSCESDTNSCKTEMIWLISSSFCEWLRYMLWKLSPRRDSTDSRNSDTSPSLLMDSLIWLAAT